MASWLTAQLKAAEGLLEAVDKTVSRTVGTLGLAEGETDQVTSSEYSGAHPTGLFPQTLPPTGQPTSQYPSPIPSRGSATYTPVAPASTSTSSAGQYYGHAAQPVPTWDARPVTAPLPFADLGSRSRPGSISNSRTTTPAAAARDGDSGFFTVKADAPIPFGASPLAEAARSNGDAGGKGAGPTGSEALGTRCDSAPSGTVSAGRSPVPAPQATSAPYPSLYPGHHLPGDSTGAGPRDAAPAPPVLSSTSSSAAYPPSASASTSTSAAGMLPLHTSRPSSSSTSADRGALTDPLASGKDSLPASDDAASVGTSATSKAAAGAGAGSLPMGGMSATALTPSSQASAAQPTGTVTGEPPAPYDLSAEPSFGTLADTAARPHAARDEQWLTGPHTSADADGPSSTGTVPQATTINPTAGLTLEPRGPPPLTPGPAGGQQTPRDAATTPGPGLTTSGSDAAATTGGTAAAAPAASGLGLASATAAATSLASAVTSSAVTHSLSLLNLVLDDADGPGAASGAAGAIAGGGFTGVASSAPFPASGPEAAQQIQALSRTCDQLRKRLEASRVENEQLEDMLARAEVRAQQESALVAALREELAGATQARAATEGSLSAQLAAARAGLAEVSDKYEVSQRAVLVLEGQLAALEESTRRLMEQHSDREGGMVDALRSELSAAESRLAAERRAHQASRSAAASRELDLEQQIAGSTAALGDLTRGLEEANRKCRALEEEVVEASRGRNDLAAQLAGLRRRLGAAGLDPDAPEEDFLAAASGGGGEGGRNQGHLSAGGAGRRGGAAAAAAAAELEVLREECAQHQRAAKLARQAAEASQAQAEALAGEVEALRQSLEQRQDTSQLESQLREVSDMLYLKQTQMERLAADKAAQQLKTERELEAVRQELAKLSRQQPQPGLAFGGGIPRTGPDGLPLSSSAHPHDVIPMDALGEPYQRLARHTKVGRAVKAAANFLDSTASTTSFVLRQYPLVRLAVFGYVVLIHLYVYLLIARMQRMATHYEAVVAAAVGPADG